MISLWNFEAFVFPIQAYANITSNLFDSLEKKKLIDIQSFSSQLYEIIIDYIFYTT